MTQGRCRTLGTGVGTSRQRPVLQRRVHVWPMGDCASGPASRQVSHLPYAQAQRRADVQRRAVILDGHVPEDVQPHLDGEDEETAHRFGWWPQRSTEATVRAAFQRWADEWQ